MEIDRRKLCLGLMTGGFSQAISTHASGFMDALEAVPGERQLFAAARRLNKDNFEGAVFDSNGKDVATVLLPSRGHDVAVRRTTGECVVFARRPGTFAIAFNRPNGLPPLPFETTSARHFYGHGVFSADGRLLFTTENDFVNDRGMIGIRDATNGYCQVGEFPSHGVGPHDLAVLSDGRTLVIANGGISTHPDEGRRMLNLASMQPNLVYLDSHTGGLLERHVLSDALHKLSIRHLSVTPTDEVVIGCQFVGPKSDIPMLVGTHRRQHPIKLLPAPSRTYGLLRNYVSSIALDRTGRYAMATSAKGSMALTFDLDKKSVVQVLPIADVSGVARGVEADSFYFTTGEGSLFRSAGDGAQQQRSASKVFAWDNHLTALQ